MLLFPPLSIAIMQRISLLNMAHNAIKEHVKLNDIVIDATLGNGHDTLFLTQQVGPLGLVFGFDIQQSAIESTIERIKIHSHLDCLRLFHTSHENMTDKIPQQFHGKISAIMFNLGYLPGGDKSIITSSDSTLNTLNTACSLISDRGIITVLAYPGHKGGDVETTNIKTWCEQLNKNHFHIEIITSTVANETAPMLFVIRKQTNTN